MPAQTLRFQRRGFRLGADVAGFCGAVGFAQRMAAGDQRDDLFIVHRHIAEGGANGRRGGQRLAAGVRTFRVDINQTHFGGADGLFRQAFRVTVASHSFSSPQSTSRSGPQTSSRPAPKPKVRKPAFSSATLPASM